jgi:hypothetical protein
VRPSELLRQGVEILGAGHPLIVRPRRFESKSDSAPVR